MTYPNNGAAYISNLLGLGIFIINPDEQLVDENLYEPIAEYAHKRYPAELYRKKKLKIVFHRGVITVTPFAQLFLKACFSKKP